MTKKSVSIIVVIQRKRHNGGRQRERIELNLSWSFWTLSTWMSIQCNGKHLYICRLHRCIEHRLCGECECVDIFYNWRWIGVCIDTVRSWEALGQGIGHRLSDRILKNNWFDNSTASAAESRTHTLLILQWVVGIFNRGNCIIAHITFTYFSQNYLAH